MGRGDGGFGCGLLQLVDVKRVMSKWHGLRKINEIALLYVLFDRGKYIDMNASYRS